MLQERRGLVREREDGDADWLAGSGGRGEHGASEAESGERNEQTEKWKHGVAKAVGEGDEVVYIGELDSAQITPGNP